MKKHRKLVRSLLLIFCLLMGKTAMAANYRIEPHDTLTSVAKLFKTSVSYLKKTNYVRQDYLVPGNTLYVSAHVYKVKKGDTLYKIAKKYNLSLTNLKKANHKSNDSIFSGETLLLPGIKPYKKSDKIISCTPDEAVLLAKLIEAEAGGESFQAKVAVGAVVINRVQSGNWAPTIKKVIYQKTGIYYQFTPVKIGTIKNKPSASSVKAAWIALFGSDPSNHAIYYFDDTSQNEWLWQRTKTAKIGPFIFAI
ncbi:MAG: N-acetylmuramoyl-L-alanine amidase [Clostridiales bacterium]|nr:N-acetylmuramoyl-L-alanine amidase [Clostridiales bacterium]